ncbi:hypothetical protein TNCV_2967831 [Trichonephila clavipes]|nr:hypothetical protein TNCV_2967831 [Trichonephila clavipes]
MKAVSVLEHFSDHGSIHQKMKKNTTSVRSYPNSAGDGKTPYEEGLVFFHLKLLQGNSRDARGHQLEEHVWVWRERDTRNSCIFFQERSHYRRCGLMVWAGISVGKCTDMHSIRNDNLTARSSFSGAETRMELPACSPDRNPIENA